MTCIYTGKGSLGRWLGPIRSGGQGRGSRSRQWWGVYKGITSRWGLSLASKSLALANHPVRV